MLQKKYKAYSNIYFHKQVENMKDYMACADVAVSTGGVTLYELCAVGTPTISFLIADNQLDNVTQFQEDGLIDYAGDMREGGFSDEVADRAALYLEAYHEDEKLRWERSLKMQKLVDGKGAKRIAEILKK
jgi:spore coat polysaccharide biosynthesis predicted glycosyltransferase SpsG